MLWSEHVSYERYFEVTNIQTDVNASAHITNTNSNLNVISTLNSAIIPIVQVRTSFSSTMGGA